MLLLLGLGTCVLLSSIKPSAAGGHFINVPVVPLMEPPPPVIYPETQFLGQPNAMDNYKFFLGSSPAWRHFVPVASPNFVPHPGCVTPYQHQIHLMRQSFQTKGRMNPFLGQQAVNNWKQPMLPNQGQGQWVNSKGQPVGNDQMNKQVQNVWTKDQFQQFHDQSFADQWQLANQRPTGQHQWITGQSQGEGQWSGNLAVNQRPTGQHQWITGQSQGEGQWSGNLAVNQQREQIQQPTMLPSPKVHVIGEWEGFQTQNQPVKVPSSSGDTGQTFKPSPLDESAFGPFNPSENSPVQSRRLR